MTYHPDFGDIGNSAMLLKHPSVVGEQQFKAESERKDQWQPQQCAENQCWHHGLSLGTEWNMEAGHKKYNGLCSKENWIDELQTRQFDMS